MISFRSDYSQGAHPKVMEALCQTNLEHTDGYGIDPHCGHAAQIIRELIDLAFEEYQDEHTPLPRMAYISQPTEIGTIYSKKELQALVILNKAIDDHFRYMIKRQCGMLAKGRLIGVQFEALLEGGEKSIYFEMATHANRLAKKLQEGLAALGVNFYSASETNQVFPVFSTNVVRELEKEFFFHEWAPEKEGKIPIRLVTGWGTEDAEVDAFLEKVKSMLSQK